MSRHFPPPWTAERIPGGYVVKDATGQAPTSMPARHAIKLSSRLCNVLLCAACGQRYNTRPRMKAKISRTRKTGEAIQIGNVGISLPR